MEAYLTHFKYDSKHWVRYSQNDSFDKLDLLFCFFHLFNVLLDCFVLFIFCVAAIDSSTFHLLKTIVLIASTVSR